MSQQNTQLPVFDLKGQDEFSDQSAISITMDIAKRLYSFKKENLLDGHIKRKRGFFVWIETSVQDPAVSATLRLG